MTTPQGETRSERIEAADFQPVSAVGPTTVRRNPLRYAAALVGLLFLLAMGFLFTARSVEIVVIAEEAADVNIDGVALPFGKRYLMRPGDYALTITASGYSTFTDTLNVSDEDSQLREITLTPLPGQIIFSDVPDGARILIDGELIGTAPLTGVAIAAGEHSLTIDAPRYLPYGETISVTGRGIEQTLTPALEPAWANISIASEPTEALVSLDGEPAGRTPASIEALQGQRQLSIQAAGFADYSIDLEVIAGEDRDLGTITLTPAAGVLELTSKPSGANVTLDGDFRGQTPLTIELTPDRAHEVQLAKPGYRRYRETLQIAAGAQESRSLTLEARLGEVVFEIAPAGALLKINGETVGTDSRTVSLPAVEHRIEVSLPGYASVKQRVTPRQGLQQLVAITLQTEQQARKARLPAEATTALGQTMRLFIPAESPRNEFTMGASRREPGRRANEVLHPVRLERLFYLQTTEVTNAQFRLFQASHNSGQVQGNSLNREHQPAVQVSWQQAAAFCNWLSLREGLEPFYLEKQGIITGFRPRSTGYRLPTEAEWSWAARVNGEALQKFAWGDEFPPQTAVENLADNTSAYVTGRILGGYTDGHVTSAPVASFPANHNGLYDMGGNVSEWIHDVYAIPPANDIVQTDPLGAPTGDNFTLRGASWALSKLTELRLTYRDYGQAGRDDVGFRLARYAE